jgi:integrase
LAWPEPDWVKLTKRGNGEGSVYQRRDGRWEASIAVDGFRRSYYGRTRREAQLKLATARRSREDGLLVPQADQTVAAYLEQWLENVAKPSVSPRTFEDYDLNVRRLRPHIGRIRLNELTPAAIQATYGTLLRKGLAPISVGHAHAVLRRALKQAVQWGLILRNPIHGVSRPRPTPKEIKTLSVSEVQRLFETTKFDRRHTLWVVLATTGLRLGEALGLTWDDIDSRQGKLQVRRALQRQRGVGLVLVEPKTKHSRRTVYLAKGSIATLAEHRRAQAQERLTAGPRWNSAHDFVFANQDGSPLQGSNLNRIFHKALRDAGLPKIRIHDLRHTAATQLLERGVHPKVVQEMLGHSTITITLDTYSHVIPSLHAHVAEHMQLLFADRTDDRENTAD